MDLLAFGETMLRLTPPGDERIEAADSLDVHVGGAESNVAVAASRLGVDAAWTSKLPDSPPAHRIVRALREQGVEPLVAAGEGRVGTYYLETGATPRGTDVVYDRTGAAVRTTTLGDLPVDAVREASAFYTSGITPALSETLAETVAEAFEVAGDAGTEVVFDVNYRSKLWSPEAARDTLRELFPAVDTLVVAARDAETVLDRDGDPTMVAAALAAEYDCGTVVVTRGSAGAVAVEDGEVHEQPAFEAASPYPVGTGDAFVGGYLARSLRGAGLADALEYAAATAALKRTIPGDIARLTPAEVEAVVDGEAEALSR
jgi:2-dehydro-3-deoxygluconokinase